MINPTVLLYFLSFILFNINIIFLLFEITSSLEQIALNRNNGKLAFSLTSHHTKEGWTLQLERLTLTVFYDKIYTQNQK